jgi:hypothetical protein
LQSSILAIIDIDHEDLVIIPYYGAKNMWLSLKIIDYTPFTNLDIEGFVLMKLTNLEIYLVWMGRGESEVVKDE